MIYYILYALFVAGKLTCVPIKTIDIMERHAGAKVVSITNNVKQGGAHIAANDSNGRIYIISQRSHTTTTIDHFRGKTIKKMVFVPDQKHLLLISG